MRSLLPSINTAFNLISQEESHRSLSAGCDKSVSAFVAKKQFKSKAKNLNLKCSHCGGQGHLVERCFQLIGFPNKGASGKYTFVKFKVFSTLGSNKLASDSMTCDSETKNENATLTIEMYDQLVKLLNS